MESNRQSGDLVVASLVQEAALFVVAYSHSRTSSETPVYSWLPCAMPRLAVRRALRSDSPAARELSQAGPLDSSSLLPLD